MPTADDVLNVALQLPERARAQIARGLLLSLEEADYEDGIGEAWAREIQRRRESISNGTVEPIEWDDALARIRASVRVAE